MGFSLHQFSEVFKILDAAGQPYVLIGGQAVNYWADRYLPVEPELKSLAPFTSEDIDFKGGTEDVQRIARQLELTPGYPPKVQMTALAGTIPFLVGGLKSDIEIVRRIPGVSGSVDAIAERVEWGGSMNSSCGRVTEDRRAFPRAFDDECRNHCDMRSDSTPML